MSKDLNKETTSCAAEQCCGGPVPIDVDACCVEDVVAKASGDDGCGCDTASAETAKSSKSSCC